MMKFLNSFLNGQHFLHCVPTIEQFSLILPCPSQNADPNLEISRDRYHPPDDPLLRAHLTLVNEYLRKTEIEDLFNSLLKVLLARTDLPYNPYPGFVRRFRVQAERFHLFAKSHEEIKEILSGYHNSSIIHKFVILVSSTISFQTINVRLLQ